MIDRFDQEAPRRGELCSRGYSSRRDALKIIAEQVTVLLLLGEADFGETFSGYERRIFFISFPAVEHQHVRIVFGERLRRHGSCTARTDNDEVGDFHQMKQSMIFPHTSRNAAAQSRNPTMIQ